MIALIPFLRKHFIHRLYCPLANLLNAVMGLARIVFKFARENRQTFPTDIAPSGIFLHYAF